MMQLEGFVFFASSSEIIGRVKDLIAESLEMPAPARIRYLILDFEHVSNVDFSAVRNFVDAFGYGWTIVDVCGYIWMRMCKMRM